ncbi:MAG TPA: transposase [Anaerolineales bacterium]|nr:transposase [Anaerolineales bacterium]
MKFDSQKHHRHSIRIKGYDYAQPGGYFVTIVTYHRGCIFGEIVDEEMRLNELGHIADEMWRAIPEHFPNAELGAHVVMPNHVHGIIMLHTNEIGISTNSSIFVGARHASPLPPRGVKTQSLGAIVGSFKSAVTRRIGREFNTTSIWQRNYFEHIIRNHEDWDRIHRYITSNPSLWAEDDENPTNHI